MAMQRLKLILAIFLSVFVALLFGVPLLVQWIFHSSELVFFHGWWELVRIAGYSAGVSLPAVVTLCISNFNPKDASVAATTRCVDSAGSA